MLDYLGQKQTNSALLQLRTKLQTHARDVLKQINLATKENDRDKLLISIGAAQSHLDARKLLTPQIAPDGYMREIQGKIIKIKKILKEIG